MSTPSVRSGALFCPDVPGKNRLLLFGGKAGSGKNDTWVFDGKTWTRLAPTSQPAKRHDAAMVLADSEAVLFGGWVNSTPNADTWTWNGTNWTRVRVGNPDLARFAHAMAYDSRDKKIVMFGGIHKGNPSDDTWLGSVQAGWSRVGKTGSWPAARYEHAMAYDAKNKTVVLFGGHDAMQDFGDTWRWDGSKWTQYLGTGPSPRKGAAMAYDSRRERVILFGGVAHRPKLTWFNDTWEWDGAKWTEIKKRSRPSARENASLAYDAARRRMVLFGGGLSNALPDNQTWEYGDEPRYELFGDACGTTPPRLTPKNLPRIGSPLDVEIKPVSSTAALGIGVVGFSNARWGATRLPIALDVFGLVGCKLYVSFDIRFPVLVDASKQPARICWTTPIPNDVGLLCGTLYQQGLVFEEGTNKLVATNAGAARVGK